MVCAYADQKHHFGMEQIVSHASRRTSSTSQLQSASNVRLAITTMEHSAPSPTVHKPILSIFIIDDVCALGTPLGRLMEHATPVDKVQFSIITLVNAKRALLGPMLVLIPLSACAMQ